MHLNLLYVFYKNKVYKKMRLNWPHFLKKITSHKSQVTKS